MYKNQLQELAQRSCFNLPSYTSIREGPDHAPRFKAVVVFNGEAFDSPHFFSTLRQAEHAAAEVALNSLSSRGPSHSLAARILDETGVYKNLLQEISQRVGAPLPQYTTFRSGLGHQPVFTGTVELAGITFTGEAAKNKKQAEKNAALAAWASLKQLAQDQSSSGSSSEAEQHTSDEMEQITIARALANYRLRERITNSTPPVPFPQKFPMPNFRPSSPQRNPAPASKILPLICPRRSHHPVRQHQRVVTVVGSDTTTARGPETRPHPLSTTRATTRPYIPIRNMRGPCHGIAPPVTIRTAMPCYSALPSGPSPPLWSSKVGGGPPLGVHMMPGLAPPPPFSKVGGPPAPMARTPPVRIAPPVQIRQVIPVHAAPPGKNDDPELASASVDRGLASMRMPGMTDAPKLVDKKIGSDAVGAGDQDRMVMEECEKPKEVELKEKSEGDVEGREGSERIEEKLEQLNVR